MSSVRFSIQCASEAVVLRHLQICNDYFMPFLDQSVGLKTFAGKIYEHAVTFEAWYGDALVGLLSGYFNDTHRRTGYINHLCVLKSHQGKGIAALLLRQCFTYAVSNGFREILLEVGRENRVAKDLYVKYGFVETGFDGGKMTMKKNMEESIE